MVSSVLFSTDDAAEAGDVAFPDVDVGENTDVDVSSGSFVDGEAAVEGETVELGISTLPVGNGEAAELLASIFVSSSKLHVITCSCVRESDWSIAG